MSEDGAGSKLRFIAVVLVVAAVAAGYFGKRWLDERSAPPSLVAVAEAPAHATAAEPATEPAPAVPANKPIPDELPVISMPDLDGKRRSTREWSGRPLLVNFWASWCGPCVKEIPMLKQMRAKFRPQKLEIVGIAVDSRENIVKFMQRLPIDYPVLLGEEEGFAALAAVGMANTAFPLTLFVDSRHRLIGARFGELHEDDVEAIVMTIVQVDGGKLDLAGARQQISETLKTLAQKRKTGIAAAG